MVQFLPLILSAAQQMGNAQQQRQQDLNQALTLDKGPNQYQVERNSRALPGLLNMGRNLGWGSQTGNMNWTNLFGG